MGTCEGRVGWLARPYMRCNGSNWAVYSPGSWDGFQEWCLMSLMSRGNNAPWALLSWWIRALYKSTYYIIIIIIIEWYQLKYTGESVTCLPNHVNQIRKAWWLRFGVNQPRESYCTSQQNPSNSRGCRRWKWWWWRWWRWWWWEGQEDDDDDDDVSKPQPILKKCN